MTEYTDNDIKKMKDWVTEQDSDYKSGVMSNQQKLEWEKFIQEHKEYYKSIFVKNMIEICSEYNINIPNE